MKFHLPEIRHDYASFEILARLHAQTEELMFNEIEINMQSTNWFDADMCAAFGAILYSLSDKLNKVNIIHIPKKVETILLKNGFLSHYGRAAIPDCWGTTIPYQRFDVEDDHFFANYIEDELIHRSEMPEMSVELLKKFRSSIFEIFSNAVSHSRSELGIFSCGQYFPNRNRLFFTVADLGVGIRQNIKEFNGQDFSSVEAIVWATEGNTTTRQGNLPGGLGLKILCEFIDLNRGCLQIISRSGYWMRREGNIETKRLNNPFPGTVVSVEINTVDRHTYGHPSELNIDDIF